MNTTISKIKLVLKEIGNSKFKYETDIKDYSYNGTDVNTINQEYYLNLQNDFNEYFATLLSEDLVDKPLVGLLFKKTAEYHNTVKTNKENFRVNYLFDKRDEKLRDSSEWTHELINSIMDAQKNTLKKIYYFLDKLYGELHYLTADDKRNFKNEFGDEENKSQIFNYPYLGKVNLKESKKDAISLLLLLEHLDFIDFSNTNKNHFIESNFTYGKNKDMLSVNSEISNIYDMKTYKRRNSKSFDELKKRLINKLSDFDFDTFLISRIK